MKADLALGIFFVVAQVVVALVTTVVVYFSQFAYDACDSELGGCNYALGSIAAGLMPLVALVALVAAVIGIVVMRGRGRRGAWVPLAGIGVTLLAFAIALAMTSAGATPTAIPAGA